MQTQIVKMINDFEHGRAEPTAIDRAFDRHVCREPGRDHRVRRSAIRTRRTESRESAPTFDATDLNHIALSVTDVQRSQKWYQKHLGLKPKGQEGFLTHGKGSLALFQGQKPGPESLLLQCRELRSRRCGRETKAAGLSPRREGGRVYFHDPDAIECQVASA